MQPLGSVHAVRRAAPNFARPLPPPRACFKLASTLHDMKLIIARQPTAAQARSQPASPTAHAAAGSHAGAHAAAGPAIRRRKRLPAHARTPRKPPARTSGGNNASGGAVPGKCSRWGERHAPLRRFTTARPPGPDGPAVLACTPRIPGGSTCRCKRRIRGQWRGPGRAAGTLAASRRGTRQLPRPRKAWNHARLGQSDGC